ncbi:MAG TPA: competence/damage-inducible protein A [Acidimicrobiia bacterium]|jgi:nicotinamide-nucleotide amidase|nr:competence/damage-inducible protein A [Acidimicrobiia bacterium]
MITEIVAVGTELLLGQITNGNAATIGAALAEAGFDVHYSVVVGDNQKRVAAVLANAVARSDAVIVTGGIGPTQDDLTREAICEAFDLEMKFSEEYATALRQRWERTGREMPESNYRQAEYPAGAEMLPNPKGTAPGLTLSVSGTPLFALPGVPEEMRYLLEHEVVPRLLADRGEDAIVHSRVLRSWGRAEAQVGELLDDLFQEKRNPSIAFLASAGEIKVRITAKAPNREAAEALIDPVETEVRRRLGHSVFGRDDETVQVVIARALLDKGWTIGTAESATGGLVAAELTSLPGASAYFRGSVVAYNSDLKESLLGVNEQTQVSETTALAMAVGARKTLDVDVSIAVVGSAGPDPLEQPAGTMIVAIATPEREQAHTLHLPGDRERVRTYATTGALHLARLGIQGRWWSPGRVV